MSPGMASGTLPNRSWRRGDGSPERSISGDNWPAEFISKSERRDVRTGFQLIADGCYDRWNTEIQKTVSITKQRISVFGARDPIPVNSPVDTAARRPANASEAVGR